MSGDIQQPVTVTATKTKPKEERKSRTIPPFNVILKNDDYHSFEFVIAVLRKALGCSEQKAYLFTHEAHHSGQAVVWTGTKEVAELKVEQIRTFHEIRDSDGAKLGPLDCVIEPA